MSAPEKIFRSETRSPTHVIYYGEDRRVGENITYIRSDIHEAEIDALKAELTALKGGPDYKSILFALCASLSLEDTIGDVWEDVIEALDQAGICADIGNMDEFQDVLKILPKPVMTLYGPVDEEDL